MRPDAERRLGAHLRAVRPQHERIRLGVVGCGNHGVYWNLQKQVFRYPEVQVVAVCDVDRSHAEQAAQAQYLTGGPMMGNSMMQGSGPFSRMYINGLALASTSTLSTDAASSCVSEAPSTGGASG